MFVGNPAIVPPAAEPEIVFTLKFPNFATDPASPPVYEITYNNTKGKPYQSGNIDFLFKDGDDIKLTFKIHSDYAGKIEFISPYINDNVTFHALYSRDSLTLRKFADKRPPGAAHASDQFICNDAYCSGNIDPRMIVVRYDNEVTKGPYTVYGFLYRTKDMNGNWTVRHTEDPGIKNGGISLATLAAIFSAIAAFVAGGIFILNRFIRERRPSF